MLDKGYRSLYVPHATENRYRTSQCGLNVSAMVPPRAIGVTEDYPQHPINPYGQTKLMVEQILTDYDQA